MKSRAPYNTKKTGCKPMTGKMAAAVLVLPVCLATNAYAEDSFTTALTGGKVSANLRLRYETVSDDAVAKDADALTLRTRLGYETAQFYGFSVLGEFEDVRTVFGMDDYAPESVHIPAYATIQDRSVTEVNRAFLRYRGVAGLDLGYGRQRIAYDNQRFIGNVGWRQDEQTFDGFTAAYTGLKDFAFNYAYITQVDGVDEIFTTNDISDNFINISYSGFSWGKFTGYAYLLDHKDVIDTSVNAGLRFDTSDTYGLRFDGNLPLGSTKALKLLYTAEYAKQDYKNTTGTIDVSPKYEFAELGASYALTSATLTGKVAYEALGSDGGVYGFQTPFATKHPFNGWADKFLTTPTVGLIDKFATLGVAFPAQTTNLSVMYHDFSADEGSGDFGSEWDFQVVKVFAPNYTLGLKYATYSAQDLPYRDTDKFWVWGEINF